MQVLNCFRIWLFVFFSISFSVYSQTLEDTFSNEILKVFRNGERNYYSEDYDSSLIYFEKYLTLLKESNGIDHNLDFRFMLIDCYFKNGSFAEALLEIYLVQNLMEKQQISNAIIDRKIDYYLGLYSYMTGNFSDAQDLFEKCLLTESEKIDSLNTLILKSLGNVFYKIGKYDSAMVYYKKALNNELKREAKMNAIIGSLYMNIGIILKKEAKYDSAEIYYKKSIAIKSSESNDPALLAGSFSNYSKFLFQIGDLSSAIFYSFKAESLYIEAFGPKYYNLASLYYGIGNIKSFENDIVGAINYYNKSKLLYDEHYTNKDAPVFSRISMSQALLMRDLGQYEQAINTYKEVLLSKNLSENLQIICLRNIGVLFLKINKTDSADYYLNNALEISTNHFGKTHLQTATCYLALANFYSKTGARSLADENFQLAINLLDTENYRDYNEFRVQYILHLVDDAAYDKAVQIAQEILVNIANDFDECSIFQNPGIQQFPNEFHSIAALALKTKALSKLMEEKPDSLIYAKKALETGLLGIQLFDQFKNTMVEEKSQLFNTEKVNILYRSAAEAAGYCFWQTADPGFLDDLFYISEKSKATILSSGLNIYANGMEDVVPDSLLRKDKGIKQEIRVFNSLIYEEQAKQKPDSMKLVYWQNKLFEKNKTLDSLNYIYSSQYPLFYDLKNEQLTVSVDELQQKINHDEVVMEYIWGEDHLFIIIISAKDTDVRTVQIPPDFNNLINHYLQSLHQVPSFDQSADTIIKQYMDDAYQLYQLLIQPFEKHDLYRKWLIIPDGLIGYLPFDALVTDQYQPAFKNFRQLPYLLKNHTISYHYSSTLFARYVASDFDFGKKKALVMAPEYGIKNQAEDSSVYTGFKILKNTVHEAEIIYSMLDGKLLLDTHATESAFKQYAPHFEIIHLAMHTALNDGEPMNSKLVFYPYGDSTEDGNLNTYEIYGLKLNADLVVLSACETGVGKLRKGEGIMNMARGFLFAGCPSLLISHWQVNDAPSFKIMEGFYDRLTMDKSIALQQAKLDYLESSDQLFSHPYYWSGYVLIGADKPVQKPISLVMIVSGCMLILLITIIVFRKRRKLSPAS